jgi:hypothetical protein
MQVPNPAPQLIVKMCFSGSLVSDNCWLRTSQVCQGHRVFIGCKYTSCVSTRVVNSQNSIKVVPRACNAAVLVRFRFLARSFDLDVKVELKKR